MKHPHMPSKGKMEVTGMHFRPAENGLTSEMDHRTARGGQGGGPMFDHGSETMIHPSMAHAVKHLKNTFGGVFGDAEKDGENEPEGKPEVGKAEKKEMPEEPGEKDEVAA